MPEEFYWFIAVGFFAQLVDGAIGMAYGVTSSSILLAMGVPPATASASVHVAKTFTGAASGLAHWRLGNIDKALLWRLSLAGMLGGVLGAFLLTNVPGDVVKPFISGYLLILGLLILYKAMGPAPKTGVPPRAVVPLGLFGGWADAMGGGGWGPIVTTSLVNQGVTPRYAVGTVNLAEFFVSMIVATTFVLTIGIGLWPVILGLIVGGVLAAPIAATATRYLSARYIMIAVGVVIVLLSVRTIYVTGPKLIQQAASLL
jgi:uncharacterized protein